MGSRKKRVEIVPGRYPGEFVGVAISVEETVEPTTILSFRLVDCQWAGEVVRWVIDGVPFLHDDVTRSLLLLFNDPQPPNGLKLLLGTVYSVNVDFWGRITSVIPLVV